MRLSREGLERLRRRHLGYRLTLVVELLLLGLLPLAQRVPGLLSLLLIVLAIVLVSTVSRYSPLRSTRPLIYGLGGLAVVLELVWHGMLLWAPPVGRWLTLPHVAAWVLFLLVAVVRKVKTLIREPFVTVSVVLGAASGYFLVGIAGGVLLTALWVLHPGGFSVTALPPPQPDGSHGGAAVMVVAPALMAGAYGLLTTVGTDLLAPGDVSVQVLAYGITIAGQLHVAILIALILGRVHRRLL
ncbi:MAG: hypothetical protein VKN13_01870 [Cyanobacteriota bacterium]|nr:hypothetical protein [Cyanobacteriota bacterium]